MNPPNVRRMTKSDFDFVISNLELFWQERAPEVYAYHHPLFIHEFSEHSLIIEGSESKIMGYLMGAVIAHKQLGYIHMVGVSGHHRKMGFARILYQHFFELSRLSGATHAKAITPPKNQGSLAFHHAMGFEAELVMDYRGPGENRYVFLKKLSP